MNNRRVVIDTNIIISSNIVSSGNPSEIMKLFYLEKIALFYSVPILAEYKRVLSYERLKIPTKTQISVINAITAGGILIEPTQSTILLPDESDRVFYDTAKASGAILITGNIKHFPNEPFIMTAKDFLDTYALSV